MHVQFVQSARLTHWASTRALLCAFPLVAGMIACGAPEDGPEATTSGGDCQDIYEYGCSDGTCATTQRTTCDTEKSLGTAEQALLIDDCKGGGPRGNVLQFLVAPDAGSTAAFAGAIVVFNQQVEADGFRANIRTATAADAALDRHIVAFDDSEQFDDDSQTTLGLASCFRRVEADGPDQRLNCTLRLFPGAIANFAEGIGALNAEVALVTALHEIGHVACLNHYLINPDTSAVDVLSAMNGNHAIDDSRAQLDYARYTAAEEFEIVETGFGFDLVGP